MAASPPKPPSHCYGIAVATDTRRPQWFHFAISWSQRNCGHTLRSCLCIDSRAPCSLLHSDKTASQAVNKHSYRYTKPTHEYICNNQLYLNLSLYIYINFIFAILCILLLVQSYMNTLPPQQPLQSQGDSSKSFSSKNVIHSYINTMNSSLYSYYRAEMIQA